MIQDLQQGAPGLRDAVARPFHFHEDPEIEVQRRHDEEGSARWVIVIHSRSTHEEVQLDPDVRAAIGPAIVLYLFSLMDDLIRCHPDVLKDVDLEAMLVQLLARVRERSS
jgi:hypothetical protein